MFKKAKIMAVAAPPDDESLGLGATMHTLISEEGAKVHVVILGEGITSRGDVRDPEACKEILEKHHQNMRTAGAYIGYNSIHSYNFSDNRFDSHALLDIVKVVEKEKEEFQPDIIFTHNAGDLNIDHRITFQAVMTAVRPMNDEKVKAVICFETPSATDSVIVDYDLFLLDGNTYDSGSDVTFSLQSLIPGFTEAVTNMQVGQEAMVYIHPSYGYGESGTSNIEPNSLLIFRINLKGIAK